MKTKKSGLWPLVWVQWYEEPPRKRTVFVQDYPRAKRVQFPRMVFAASRVLWFCTDLHAFKRERENGPLVRLVLPNMGRSCVCLGSATRRVFFGLTDPVTAYWNTAWDSVPRDHCTHIEYMSRRTPLDSAKASALLMTAVATLIIGMIGFVGLILQFVLETLGFN